MTRGARLYASVVDAIGETPLVELARLTKGTGGRILAKLENLNPGHSKKDRIARQIIEEARASGELLPGQPVVELTSGNTGTGAAIVCAVLGHRFIAVMSRGNSPERARMMAAFGAEVVLIDQAEGSLHGQVSGDDLARVEAAAQQITAAQGAFRIDQFVRSGNALAHQLTTGPEIWAASGGSITAHCDLVGSGGSFAGLHRAFLARNSAVRGYIVEPASAAVLAGGPVTGGHALQGGGYAMQALEQLEGIVPDGHLAISDAEAVVAARRLAREEGIFGGFSAGANIAAALRLLAGPEVGGTIAVLICDSGMKYLSTPLWESDRAK